MPCSSWVHYPCKVKKYQRFSPQDKARHEKPSSGTENVESTTWLLNVPACSIDAVGFCQPGKEREKNTTMVLSPLSMILVLSKAILFD